MIVSDCCGAPVSAGIKNDYPLGGSTWPIPYKVNVCDQCDRECETKIEEEETMTYIQDKPAGIQEIELHMHELMTFRKFNRWDIGRLDRWIDNRPDQIHNATVGLREFFEEINSCPKELGEMDEAFDELYRCQVANCWSLMDLNKWLETYPDIIFDATLRLENILEDMFPTITHIEADRGSLQPHYHQAV